MSTLQPSSESAAVPVNNALLLLRVKAIAFRNGLHQMARERPWQLAGTISSLLMIWCGLYVLLLFTFREINKHVFESIVATPLIFTFFFLALTGMLAFSNAILCYGGLFRRKESEFLLATPVSLRDLVIVRYVESLAMSSWSLLLLGLPLMLAVGAVSEEPWSFYPLFLGIFLIFIPLPGALGLLLAWAMVRLAPKKPQVTLAALGIILLGAMAAWGWNAAHGSQDSSVWLRRFYDRVSIVQNPWLPPTWVSKGIMGALQDNPSESAYYLWVTGANALFFSVLAVGIVASDFTRTFARAQVSNAQSVRRSGRVMSWIAEVLFAYLPRQQRLLAVKDLKSFFRDPMQWSQMAILLALLLFYVGNVRRLWGDMTGERLRLLLGFLNLAAVSLILATFTSRFVFPLVSLEGQQLWLLGLLPIRRRRMITAKFLYALTITLVTAVAVMGFSAVRLELTPVLITGHMVAVVSICIGLCGVSIGLGARLPVFHERNPARIAGGFGGTISLLVSVGLVIGTLVCMGVMSWRAMAADFGGRWTGEMFLWMLAVVVLNVGAAATAMKVGIHHFDRVEW